MTLDELQKNLDSCNPEFATFVRKLWTHSDKLERENAMLRSMLNHADSGGELNGT